MPGLILAAVTPDNTPHGYNLTFAFPMLLFIVVGTILYLLLARPHARIPGRQALAPARAAAPDSDTARAAAVAGGLPTAAGGGAVESHLEPAGPAAGAGAESRSDPEGPAAGAGAESRSDPGGPAAGAGAESRSDPEGPAAAAGPAAGSVSGRDRSTDEARQQDRDAPGADGTEASE